MFVIGAFVSILEPAPSAHVVDEYRFKRRVLSLDLPHKGLKTVSSINPQAASTRILKNLNDFETALVSIPADCRKLIFRRVFLVVS